MEQDEHEMITRLFAYLTLKLFLISHLMINGVHLTRQCSMHTEHHTHSTGEQYCKVLPISEYETFVISNHNREKPPHYFELVTHNFENLKNGIISF